MLRPIRILRKNQGLLFLLLIILSPVFWQLCFQAGNVSKEWVKAPAYFKLKTNSIFSKENLKYAEDLRWRGFKTMDSPFLARFFYNKLTVLVNEFFTFISFLSPRFYFQSGDGSIFSPKGVEPIPIVLFPFWVLGIANLIKKKFFKPFLYWIFFGLFAFLVGKRVFAFLFPLGLINLYFVSQGLISIKKNLFWLISLGLIFIYSLLLIVRAFFYL